MFAAVQKSKDKTVITPSVSFKNILKYSSVEDNWKILYTFLSIAKHHREKEMAKDTIN